MRLTYEMGIKVIKKNIQQSSRTALFARVSVEAENILTLLLDTAGQVSISDEAVRAVDRHLLVHSAEEYYERFPAVFYFSLDDGKIIIQEEKDPCMAGKARRAVCFKDSGELWEKLCGKRSPFEANGKRERAAYRLFRDARGMEELRALRKRLIHRFLRLGETLPDEEIRDLLELETAIGAACYEIRSILPLLAEELTQEEEQTAEDGMKTSAVVQERIYLWLSGKLCAKERGAEAAGAGTTGGGSFIPVENEAWRQLLLAVFCPEQVRRSGMERLYLDMYDRAVLAFAQIAKEKAELGLGVEAYFKQGRGTAEDMELLVLNVSPKELLLPENRKILEIYFDTVNTKHDYSSTIWMGILPGAVLKRGLRGDVKQRFLGGEKRRSEALTKETVLNLLEITGKNRILLFYQYETDGESSARVFAEKGAALFREKGAVYEKSVWSRYISCCYPNLTVLEDEIYIGAAFVGAGLTAALDSSSFLRQFYRNVEPEVPGVRFNIEENQSYAMITAAVPKELYPYGSQAREDIAGEKYGCLLVSGTGTSGWGSSPGMMLCAARTLERGENGYLPVCCVRSEVYISRLLSALTHDFREEEIRFQLSGAPGSWLLEVKGQQACVNTPIRQGDVISFRKDGRKEGQLIFDWDKEGNGGWTKKS